MLLDTVRASNGEDITKIDKQYKKLKSIEKMVEAGYKSGEISEEKYKNYKLAIAKYEGAN